MSFEGPWDSAMARSSCIITKSYGDMVRFCIHMDKCNGKGEQYTTLGSKRHRSMEGESELVFNRWCGRTAGLDEGHEPPNSARELRVRSASSARRRSAAEMHSD